LYDNYFKKIFLKKYGRIELKKDFYLTRFVKDALENDVDILRVEFQPYYGKCWTGSDISSRDFAGIKQEILEFMKTALNEYNEFLIKEFENGHI
jgi:hypothetical protein